MTGEQCFELADNLNETVIAVSMLSRRINILLLSAV
jgi:hypothetical protein